MSSALFTRTPSRPENALAWRGWAVRGRRGEMIGKIEEIYVADETAAPDWALIRGDGPASSTSFLPLRGSRSEANEVIVPFTRTQVTRAPHVQRGSRLSPDQGAALYDYYGIADSDRGTNEASPHSAWEKAIDAEQKLSTQLSRLWHQWLSNLRGHSETTRSASAAEKSPARPNPVQPSQGERDEDAKHR